MDATNLPESNEALPTPHSEDVHSPRENLFQASRTTGTGPASVSTSAPQQGSTFTGAKANTVATATPMTTENATMLSNGHVDGKKITPPRENDVFIIGIAGGSASGKTSVSKRIIQNLNVPQVILISMDSFYKVLTPEQSAKAVQNDYNFDHPDAFEFPLLYKALKKLKEGKTVEIPNYDFTTHSRRLETQTIHGASVIIFEGILSLYDKSVMSMMDMKIFVDTDADVRLSRRLIRDISERGRDLKGILEQYSRFVKPSFDDFIQPTVRNADIIIPRGLDNSVAIDLITKHIARQLEERKAYTSA